MRLHHFRPLAALGLLTIHTGCHRAAEAPCPDQEIMGASPQFHPCVADPTSQAARVFVINSPQEFSAAFPCSSYRPGPAAFSDSTLLVGWKNYCCCGHVKSQRLLYSCASNTYTYRVEITPGLCAAAFPVTSQLLVPKLPAGANVLIDMQ